MAGPACAVVLAAGRGARMGQDKALLDLGGTTAIEHALRACRLGGVEHVVVVRHAEAASLPEPVREHARVITLDSRREMLDSLRAGLTGVPTDAESFVVFPVDHALAGHETVATVLAQLRGGGVRVALPLWQNRPGHPIALCQSLRAEIDDPSTGSLRDVIRRDPARTAAVPVRSPWVRRDLDTPTDLAAARATLTQPSAEPVHAAMRAHRSHRAFADRALPPGLLDELVDTARHASTSSFIQAYAVVAVEEPERKAAAAKLCADQRQIHEAPVFLALCADLHKIERACTQHATGLDASGLELFLQATVDTALLGQNLLLAAEAAGLGGCMIGAARNNPVELATLLGLPERCYVVFGMTLGYPTDDPEPRTRMPLAGVLHRERYDAAGIDEVLLGADEAMRAWAQRINARGGYGGKPVNTTRGWSDRMARLWAAPTDDASAGGTYTDRHILAPLRRLGFDLRQ